MFSHLKNLKQKIKNDPRSQQFPKGQKPPKVGKGQPKPISKAIEQRPPPEATQKTEPLPTAPAIAEKNPNPIQEIANNQSQNIQEPKPKKKFKSVREKLADQIKNDPRSQQFPKGEKPPEANQKNNEKPVEVIKKTEPLSTAPANVEKKPNPIQEIANEQAQNIEEPKPKKKFKSVREKLADQIKNDPRSQQFPKDEKPPEANQKNNEKPVEVIKKTEPLTTPSETSEKKPSSIKEIANEQAQNIEEPKPKKKFKSVREKLADQIKNDPRSQQFPKGEKPPEANQKTEPLSTAPANVEKKPNPMQEIANEQAQNIEEPKPKKKFKSVREKLADQIKNDPRSQQFPKGEKPPEANQKTEPLTTPSETSEKNTEEPKPKKKFKSLREKLADQIKNDPRSQSFPKGEEPPAVQKPKDLTEKTIDEVKEEINNDPRSQSFPKGEEPPPANNSGKNGKHNGKHNRTPKLRPTPKPNPNENDETPGVDEYKPTSHEAMQKTAHEQALKDRENRDEAKGHGRKYADEALNRKMEGLTREERRAYEESTNKRIDREIQGAERRLLGQQGRKGQMGHAATAQQRDVQRMGQEAKQEYGRELDLLDAEQRNKKRMASLALELNEAGLYGLDAQKALDDLLLNEEKERAKNQQKRFSNQFTRV